MANLPLTPLPDDLARDPSRFWKKVVRAGPGDCWPWMASRDKAGYGRFWLDLHRRYVKPHRLSYVLHKGEATAGKLVIQTCDNRLCCNPTHLAEETRAESVARAIRDGRWHEPHLLSQPGGRNPRAKLSTSDVLKIRDSSEPAAVLAARHNVATSTIRSIRNGRAWAHLPRQSA